MESNRRYQKIATAMWNRDGDLDSGVVRELSARATNRGITANVIHAFDGLLSCSGAKNAAGAEADFEQSRLHSTLPNVPWSHNTLLDELREHYKPDGSSNPRGHRLLRRC